MDKETLHALRKLNLDFYESNSKSFSDTRDHPWEGWSRVVQSLESPPRSVLDVACGNLRFKAYLENEGTGFGRDYYAVDSCNALLPENIGCSYQNVDIISALEDGSFLTTVEAPACDLVVCFGFMHHVPTANLRQRLVDALLDKTLPGGILAISFWQFALDPKARDKALDTTKSGCAKLGLHLDRGDFLLGWKGVEGAYRYCHSFSDEEIDEISSSANNASIVNRFRADGRTGAMNGYLVFRKTS